MKRLTLILVPLLIAVVLLAEVIPSVRRGTLGPAHVAALMVAGICLGIAYAALRARRR
ncbi:MAG TPA: hypothetical protein VFP94_06670 [Terriglobales bacterium]|nr:hypothetical protein [Terriglobales bacterium]